MNAPEKQPQPAGLALLREPFPAHQISKLPKGTKAQNDCDAKEKINCSICGGWHHPKVIHLDYVGHAALTDRLLDADPLWTWEPLALRDGLPAFDQSGGLWIKLTVCGHTRIGYGHAAPSQYKDIGAREKEVIGDALRNAAMRFGAALELWHKGDLHVEKEEVKNEEEEKFLKDIAAELVELVEAQGKGADAYDYLTHQRLTNEEKEALWGILKPNSKTRSAIKAEGQKRQELAKQQENK